MDDLIIKQWNRFVAEHGPRSGTFLQSWKWGKFQESIGRKIFRFTMENNKLHEVIARPQAVAISSDSSEIAALSASRRIARNDNIGGVMQIIKMLLPLGKSYLYIPRGPIYENQELTPRQSSGQEIKNYGFMEKLKNLAKKEKATFVKLELPVENEDYDKTLILNSSFSLLSHNIQPQDTIILGLDKSENELLSKMHEKTRYNIRLAERKGVTVRWSTIETTRKDLESFWKLAQETAKRDKFNYHPKSYYSQMLGICENQELRIGNQGNNKNLHPSTSLRVYLILAEKDDETLAANIVVFFGNTVTYLHGASNYERRELMAPYLLQWRAIQEAKRLGYRYYDFWGIAPQESRIKNQELRHSWAGITRFKMGFGGEIVNYAPTVDLIVNNFWYKLYSLGKRLFKH